MGSIFNRELRALIFGAPPPPFGGVASILLMLKIGLKERKDVLFIHLVPKALGSLQPFRPLVNYTLVLKNILQLRRGGSCLFFSGAGPSFYEKLLWVATVVVFRRHAVLMMIDGNFPKFWFGLPENVRNISLALLRRSSVTLAVQSVAWESPYRRIFTNCRVMSVKATVHPDFLVSDGPIKAAAKLGEIRIIFVGWIIPAKGIPELLDCLVLLKQNFCSVSLLLVGPVFEWGDHWRREIERRSVIDNVRLTGLVGSREELIGFYRASDIFVLPSYSEGLPVSLLEAMSQDLACVATNVGGIPEVLDYGRCGILVEPNDTIGLYRALVKLGSSPTYRASLSELGTRHIKKEYSFEAFVASYLKLFKLS